MISCVAYKMVCFQSRLASDGRTGTEEAKGNAVNKQNVRSSQAKVGERPGDAAAAPAAAAAAAAAAAVAAVVAVG